MNIENLDRRRFLKKAAQTAIAGGAVMLEAQPAVAKSTTPSELGDRIGYFPPTAESIQFINDRIVFTRGLSKQEILIVFTSDIEIAGQNYSIDSTNHPESGQVLAVAAATPLPELSYSVSRLPTTWQAIEYSKAQSYAELLQDLKRAGEVQITRSRQPGQCGLPNGCTNTRLVLLSAHTDNKRILFEPVLDQQYT